MENEALKQKLCEAYNRLNGALTGGVVGQEQIVASARSDDGSVVAIKRKAGSSETLSPENLSHMDLRQFSLDGDDLREDERLLIHKTLYKTFPYIKGIVYTESRWCSIWSSLGGALPPLSALHARHFFGEIPCTPAIKRSKPDGGVEESIYAIAGKLVVSSLKNRIASQMQAVFIRNLGAVTWGSSVEEACNNAIALEELAFRALQVRQLAGDTYMYIPYEISKKLYFEQPWHIPFETEVEKTSLITAKQEIEDSNDKEE